MQEDGFLTGLRATLAISWSAADRSVKRRMCLGILLLLIAAALTGLLPLLFAETVDALTSHTRADTSQKMVILLAGFVGIHCVTKIFSEVRAAMYGQAEQRLNRGLSQQLFQHLATLPLRFHLQQKVGAVSQVLVSGLTGHRLILHHAAYTVAPVTVELITISIVLWHLNRATYFILFVVVAFLYGIVFIRGARWITGPARALTAANVEAHGVLTDSLLNYETIKCFGIESVVQARYERALACNEGHWADLYRRRSIMGVTIAAIFAASLAVALGCATYSVNRNDLSIGEFVLVNSYMLRLATPLEMLGFAIRDITEGISYLQKMLALLTERPERDSGIGRVTRAGSLAIRFQDVDFSYIFGHPVLRNVSFCIPAGKRIAIVGASGSGKSSLIRLLLRLYEPDRGDIFLDGVSISSLSLTELRRVIAVVPQDTILFNDTIANNITLGEKRYTQSQVEWAARVAGLDTLLKELPDGAQTVVGERGLKLSGGEKQRVAIARAVIRRPRAYVFDEATSSLDTRTEQAVWQHLAELVGKTTTVIVAHRLSTIVDADEILVLSCGQIVEQGNHTQLLARSGHYAALWRAQQERGSVHEVNAAVIG